MSLLETFSSNENQHSIRKPPPLARAPWGDKSENESTAKKQRGLAQRGKPKVGEDGEPGPGTSTNNPSRSRWMEIQVGSGAATGYESVGAAALIYR